MQCKDKKLAYFLMIYTCFILLMLAKTIKKLFFDNDIKCKYLKWQKIYV